MGFTFDRPIGAGADVLELEFVSTLLQTNVNRIRQDGSIRAEDVSLFLSSRYGITISSQSVSDRLFSAFSSSPSSSTEAKLNNDGELVPDSKTDKLDVESPGMGEIPPANVGGQLLDLVELVALLLIPYLCCENTTMSGKFGTILRMFLVDAGVAGGLVESKTQKTEDEGAADLEDLDVEWTVPLLQRLFRSLGETELAQDETLLHDMIGAASGKDDGASKAGVKLNESTFLAALTHDLTAWDPDMCQKFQTTADDVRNMASNMRKSMTSKFEMTGGSEEGKGRLNKEYWTDPDVTSQRTASFLDLVADTFRSRSLVIFSWLFFGMSFFTYYSGVGTFLTLPPCDAFVFRASWADNLGAFACTVGWAVFRWVYIVAVMSAYGLAYFVLVCMGNSIETKSPFPTFVGFLAATAFTVYPLYIPQFTRSDPIIDLLLKTLTSLFGGIVAALNLWYSLILLFSLVPCSSNRYKLCWVSGPMKEEAMLKQAGKAKTEALVSNAMELHLTKDVKTATGSHLGQVLLNYAYFGNLKSERIGGFVWTWSRIWNGDLFKKEGFWFSGRLVSINVAQFFLSIFILAGGLIITVLLTRDYQPPSNPIEQLFGILFNLSPQLENLNTVIGQVSTSAANFVTSSIQTTSNLLDCPDDVANELWANCTVDNWDGCFELGQDWLCSVVGYTKAAGVDAAWEVQAGLLERAGLTMDDITNSSTLALATQSREAVQTLYPTEKYMIFTPLFLGTIAAFVTALTIALTLVPSMTTTVLKLRSGVMDLMRDPKQKALRAAPDQVAFLRGAMFWGTIFSAGLMGVIVALIVFLFVYQNTATIAMQVLAMFIGILVVIIVQFLLVRSCRMLTSQAFYRKRVLFANVILLMRECAFFALSVGFTIFRVAKLIGTTILFVGRVDTPFLAPGIGEIEAFGFKLDNHPYVFLMDLLYHEAHRHPYIQIWGAICLLQLRLPPNTFVTRTGSAWRLVLVLMLMPWLTRYRQLARRPLSAKNWMMSPNSTTFGEDDWLQDDEEDTDAAGGVMKAASPEDMQRQIRMLKEQLYATQMMRAEMTRKASLVFHETIEV